jgi:EAL domain-containing protein (putative c-di-GMP-specific phosphodiesterase class I)
LQADLKLAIEHSELRLHYQPQLKITGEITGFEALARWQSPKRKSPINTPLRDFKFEPER